MQEMTPQADLEEILSVAENNGLDLEETTNLIISEGWVSIHHPIAAQIAAYIADEMEVVINTGKLAQGAEYGDMAAAGAALRDMNKLQTEPHEWTRGIAQKMGAAQWTA